MFGFLWLFVSPALTVCYSFLLFYFVLCGDFNFVPSYSMVESNYNMIIGMVGLLVMSIFDGGSCIITQKKTYKMPMTCFNKTPIKCLVDL